MLLALLVLLLLTGVAYAMRYQPPSMDSIPDLPGKVQQLASAIARAEGWLAGGSLPQLRNNPGALRLHGETDDITQFGSPDEGWDALYKQVQAMLIGTSSYYFVDMSLIQVAQIYTGGDNPDAWAANVAAYLDLSPTSTLADFLKQKV